VAVQFLIKSTSTNPYSDSPGNGAAIVDTVGQPFSSSAGDTGAGPGCPGTVKLPTGRTAAEAFVTFEYQHNRVEGGIRPVFALIRQL
jgi:hypothetical protein